MPSDIPQEHASADLGTHNRPSVTKNDCPKEETVGGATGSETAHHAPKEGDTCDNADGEEWEDAEGEENEEEGEGSDGSHRENEDSDVESDPEESAIGHYARSMVFLLVNDLNSRGPRTVAGALIKKKRESDLFLTCQPFFPSDDATFPRNITASDLGFHVLKSDSVACESKPTSDASLEPAQQPDSPLVGTSASLDKRGDGVTFPFYHIAKALLPHKALCALPPDAENGTAMVLRTIENKSVVTSGVPASTTDLGLVGSTTSVPTFTTTARATKTRVPSLDSPDGYFGGTLDEYDNYKRIVTTRGLPNLSSNPLRFVPEKKGGNDHTATAAYKSADADDEEVSAKVGRVAPLVNPFTRWDHYEGGWTGPVPRRNKNNTSDTTATGSTNTQQCLRFGFPGGEEGSNPDSVFVQTRSLFLPKRLKYPYLFKDRVFTAAEVAADPYAPLKLHPYGTRRSRYPFEEALLDGVMALRLYRDELFIVMRELMDLEGIYEGLKAKAARESGGKLSRNASILVEVLGLRVGRWGWREFDERPTIELFIRAAAVIRWRLCYKMKASEDDEEGLNKKEQNRSETVLPATTTTHADASSQFGRKSGESCAHAESCEGLTLVCNAIQELSEYHLLEQQLIEELSHQANLKFKRKMERGSNKKGEFSPPPIKLTADMWNLNFKPIFKRYIEDRNEARRLLLLELTNLTRFPHDAINMAKEAAWGIRAQRQAAIAWAVHDKRVAEEEEASNEEGEDEDEDEEDEEGEEQPNTDSAETSKYNTVEKEGKTSGCKDLIDVSPENLFVESQPFLNLQSLLEEEHEGLGFDLNRINPWASPFSVLNTTIRDVAQNKDDDSFCFKGDLFSFGRALSTSHQSQTSSTFLRQGSVAEAAYWYALGRHLATYTSLRSVPIPHPVQLITLNRENPTICCDSLAACDLCGSTNVIAGYEMREEKAYDGIDSDDEPTGDVAATETRVGLKLSTDVTQTGFDVCGTCMAAVASQAMAAVLTAAGVIVPSRSPTESSIALAKQVIQLSCTPLPKKKDAAATAKAMMLFNNRTGSADAVLSASICEGLTEKVTSAWHNPADACPSAVEAPPSHESNASSHPSQSSHSLRPITIEAVGARPTFALNNQLRIGGVASVSSSGSGGGGVHITLLVALSPLGARPIARVWGRDYTARVVSAALALANDEEEKKEEAKAEGRNTTQLTIPRSLVNATPAGIVDDVASAAPDATLAPWSSREEAIAAGSTVAARVVKASTVVLKPFFENASRAAFRQVRTIGNTTTTTSPSVKRNVDGELTSKSNADDEASSSDAENECPICLEPLCGGSLGMVRRDTSYVAFGEAEAAANRHALDFPSATDDGGKRACTSTGMCTDILLPNHHHNRPHAADADVPSCMTFPTQTSCGHWFHSQCLEQFMTKNKSTRCPLCRAEDAMESLAVKHMKAVKKAEEELRQRKKAEALKKRREEKKRKKSGGGRGKKKRGDADNNGAGGEANGSDSDWAESGDEDYNADCGDEEGGGFAVTADTVRQATASTLETNMYTIRLTITPEEAAEGAVDIIVGTLINKDSVYRHPTDLGVVARVRVQL